MGHIASKDIYRRLGHRLDQAPVRTPWTPVFRDLVQELYSRPEAEVVSRLPYRPSTLGRIARMLGEPEDALRPMLDGLCAKGLVIDIWDGAQYLYMVSPIVIGFFEFTMMRTGPDLPQARWAELFQAYMFGEKDFLQANFGDGQRTSVMRALPHEEALGDHVEILDYEKASALVEEHTEFSLGLCSCRHEKHHLGHEPCPTPMDTCTSMGTGARFLIRNGFARPIDKARMRDILARSRDSGLTLSADNVRRDAGFICHCCGCCCNLLRGVRETGYTGILVTASVVAVVDEQLCNGCGMCAKACPVSFASVTAREPGTAPGASRKVARIDPSCLGCGVCALKCPTGALKLHPRPGRVIHPEDSFERVMLQALERDTFQTFLFDNPASRTQEFMRALVGGFLKLPPVKRALLSEKLRSRFLSALRRLGG
jgi:NAD-dependent dihydropyrimidine dehydrogenase PreA subunit